MYIFIHVSHCILYRYRNVTITRSIRNLRDVKTPTYSIKKAGLKKISCRFCRKRYKNKISLRRHMTIHNERKRLECGSCPRIFTYKESMRKHILNAHPKTQAVVSRLFICDLCAQDGFRIYPDSSKQPYTRASRWKTFVSQVKFQKPSIIDPEDQFRCAVCQEKFESALNLKEHLECIHLKLFTCCLCLKHFPNKDNMEEHVFYE